MQSVVNDRGSFTVEASLICTFIVIVIMNLVVLLFQVCDLCIIHEDISRRIIEINNEYENKELSGYIKGDSVDNSIRGVIDKIEQENNYGIRKLFCMDIYKVDYSISGTSLKIEVNYGFKEFGKSIMNKIFNLNNCYSFSRKYELNSICDMVREGR